MQFGGLAEAIDALAIPLHRDALVEIHALQDRLAARVNAAVAAFDAAQSYEDEGASSMAAFLRHDCGRTPSDASRACRKARTLRQVPVVQAAWEEGRLTGGQVDVILAAVGRHVDRFANDSDAVVPLLEGLDVAQTAVAMRSWREKADALDEPDETTEPDDTVHLSRTLDGHHALNGSLGPGTGELVRRALDAADTGDREVPAAERRARALRDIASFFLDHHDTDRVRRHRPHVHLLFDLDDLTDARATGEWFDGTRPDPATSAQTRCDSVVHRVVRDGSAILDYGHGIRTVPVRLFNAVAVRDRGCRWPGCDRPVARCEAHHVHYWEHGGATSIHNLVLLCPYHHHRIHTGRWRAKLLPDATLEITHPDGRVEPTTPPTRRARGRPPRHGR